MFIEGFIERPIYTVGVIELMVNDKLVLLYDSSEYILAFQPSNPVTFVILDESIIDITFSLFNIFGINVNVPRP